MKCLSNLPETLFAAALALGLAALPAAADWSGTGLPGDVHGDGKVNILDMIAVRNHLNEDPGSGDNWRYDVNGDGSINILDLVSVRNHLNTKWEDYARLSGLPQPKLSSYYSSESTPVAPSAPAYPLPLDLDQVDNLAHVSGMVGLNEDSRALLAGNGFVVSEPRYALARLDDITFTYDHMSACGVPNFVTSDTMLHLYHVQFDEILRGIEEREFMPQVQAMSAEFIDDSLQTYAGAAGDVKEAARRNVAFFAVAMKLLDPDYEVQELVAAEVNAELACIEAHAGFAYSAIFGYKEDYSQYVPRGHYTRSEALKKYFKAMMWYGRLGFLLKGCDQAGPGGECFITAHEAKIQTIQASLITIALAEGCNPVLVGHADSPAELQELSGRAAWPRIYEVTSYFVGLADDLTPYEYVEPLVKVFGSPFLIRELNDDARMFDLKAELAQLRYPEIYGGTGFCTILPPFTPEKIDECLDKSKGMRFMGQRFIPDSYMFQNLVLFDYLGSLEGDWPFTLCITGAGRPGRCFPRGLDVMAILGSAEALNILEAEGDTDYDLYDEEFNKLKDEFDAFDELEWNRNLYWSWLYTLKALLAECGEGYPTFMQTTAWLDKQLHTALASWTELRHDTILYAKQSYTPYETSVPPEPDQGFVEPVPQFYGRLLALTRMTRTGLTDLEVLNDLERNRLLALEQILERLISISGVELEGLALTQSDADFIRNFGAYLQPVLEGVSAQGGQTTIVADVHTEMNTGLVLEEGVGYVHLIVAAHKLPDGRIVVGAGPVFSYYEFKWPMNDRLTDEAWKTMLENGQQPARPPWTSSFIDN